MKIQDWLERTSRVQIEKLLSTSTADDVETVLNKNNRLSETDFLVLLSDAATPFLETMAQKSFELTRKRFGNTIQMFAPLYLSNECQNICTYCGFSLHNKIPRITLTEKEIISEVNELKRHGFNHILLVTGESQKEVGIKYFLRAIHTILPHIENISLEVQPLEEEEYAQLASTGASSILVYQETYHREIYKEYHPKGMKRNFDYRLETPERIGKAGIHKIGLGVLLGLDDWRIDSFYTAMHLRFLEKKFWKTRYSISLPRLRPAVGIEGPRFPVSDKDLVQLICAWRLFDEHLEISLSTRETFDFRNHVMKLGITSMSAGSKTNPGGYALHNESLEQFEISDERSPGEVALSIQSVGMEPVWKDWSHAFDLHKESYHEFKN